MSDSQLPSAPRLPTFPARPDRGQEFITTQPPDDSLEGQMVELGAALRQVSELAIRLETSLLQARMAILTDEHKINRVLELQEEQARDHAHLAKRLEVVENLLAGAAE